MNNPSNSPDNPNFLNGQLLLASPSLRDGLFAKSVVYIAEHTKKDGAYGLILNHPTSQTVGNLLSDDRFQDLKNISVHIGGPISQELLTFATFTTSDDQSPQLTTRISAENAISHTQKPGTLVRAFAGYAGWTPGQLEEELEQDSWIVIQTNQHLMSNDHDKSLWSHLLRKISPFHKILAEAPDDIFIN